MSSWLSWRPFAQYADVRRHETSKATAYLARDFRYYAPIANPPRSQRDYQELEDLSFKYIYPNRYNVIAKAIKTARGNRKEVISKILESLKTKLADSDIEATVEGREKHLYSVIKR